jgi:hypothetical protein
MPLNDTMFHVFRNTPFGRETFLQSLDFCQKLDLKLHLYIPKSRKFLLYLGNRALQIELTSAYLRSPSTAEEHVHELIQDDPDRVRFYTPADYSASNLPDIDGNFQFMTCPRNISDLSTKISLGHIGSKVRQILFNATFPVLVPNPVFKPWHSITVMFGGSINSIKCLQLGLNMARITGLPLDIFTQGQGKSQQEYRDILEQRGVLRDVEEEVREWYFFPKGPLENNLYSVPHESLVIAGTYGQKDLKGFFFGSTMEKLQSILPNNLLLLSHHFRKHPWFNPYRTRMVS